jgi:uncharacterized protein (DUF58 family)
MSDLTGRGRVLLALGLVGIGAGWGISQTSVIIVAVLLVLLPLLGVLLVRRSTFVIGAARKVSPTRLPFGDTGEVVLTLENGSRLTSGALLLEDHVPESLGHPTRLVLDRVPPRAQRSVRYPIEGLVRGRTAVGPLSVVLTDPFGTARVVRTFTSTTSLAVTPRVVSLGSSAPSMVAGGRGEARFRAIAARGDDDLLPREHRAGDDMRRIHWRATASQGELMVRREEQAWHSSLTLILDDRVHAHIGSGATSTFEWAVSAVASIALHYLRGGWTVTILSTTGRVLVDPRTVNAAEVDLVLQTLAEVRLVESPMVTSFGLDSDASTAVVAVLGRVTSDAAEALARPAAGLARPDRSGAGGFAGCLLLEPGPVELLTARGWRVSQWNRSTEISAAWAQVAGGHDGPDSGRYDHRPAAAPTEARA